MTKASALRTVLSLILLPPLVLTGCGGGMTSPSTIQQAPVDLKKPQVPKPKPVTLAKSYHMNILPCAGACQAEALNDSGVVVGWEVLDGQAFAVAWTGVEMHTLGEGYALAVNNAGTWVGYTGFPPAATVNGAVIPTLDGYDASEATAIDEDGTVVGLAFSMADPSVQVGWRWTPTLGMSVIPELSEALAIHRGVAGGIGVGGNAMAGQDLGIQGAVTALSDAGAAGFTFGSITQAFTFQQGMVIQLGIGMGSMSLASGIGPGGVVVGQVGSSVNGSVRLARQRQALARVAHFVGTTQAMAWTPIDGMVNLNTRIDTQGYSLPFATGIDSKGRIVGAAVQTDTQQTLGFMLTPQ